MKKIENNKLIYIVDEILEETHDVKTLKLKLENGEIPSFIPGQFITIYFEESGTPEGKSYSISSSPKEKTLNITVKSMGEFSKKLCNMKCGDRIKASSPYGFFYSESDNSHMIIITQGIGMAPFRSIILDKLNNKNRKIDLFYTNKTKEDIIFRKEFDKIKKENKNIKIKYFITRNKEKDRNYINRRIETKDILGNIKTIKDKEFFICGSISFVRDFWNNLIESGIKEGSIYTEAFFSH